MTSLCSLIFNQKSSCWLARVDESALPVGTLEEQGRGQLFGFQKVRFNECLYGIDERCCTKSYSTVRIEI